MTKNAESALNAQSQTQRWCPIMTFSCLKSKLGLIVHTLTVVSADHVATYLNESRYSSKLSLPQGITYRASGLSRQRVRYLPCATNRVTAWNCGSPEISSRRNSAPVRKYNNKGTFIESLHQAALLLPAIKHEPYAASVIKFYWHVTCRSLLNPGQYFIRLCQSIQKMNRTSPWE